MFLPHKSIYIDTNLPLFTPTVAYAHVSSDNKYCASLESKTLSIRTRLNGLCDSYSFFALAVKCRDN